jgi:hypothetical protein
MPNGTSDPDAGAPTKGPADAGAPAAGPPEAGAPAKTPADAGTTDSGLPAAAADANQCFAASPVAGVVPVPCPTCPTDFVVTAPCRILKAGGGNVQMSAADLPTPPPGGFFPGNYVWTTPSTKIRLTNANSPTVTVEPLDAPSAGRDAETITVTRNAAGCSPVKKTVNVTVAKVTFSVSANQRYGYDDFDTPGDTLDDHICVKQSDYTFLKVDIAGGAVGTDFDFVCDDTSTCVPVAPDASASFDLRLNAGSSNSASTVLQAKVKCPSKESFTHIAVHVYKEKLVEVVVAKIYDSTKAGTNLSFPTTDYGAHTATVNAKTKEAVVKYDISNFDPANGKTDVRYDLDGDGALSWDIKNGGGAEFNAISAAITGTGTKIRIAIVKDMKSYYYLSAAASVGDRTIAVTAGSVFQYPAAGSYPLGAGASQENVSVASSSGSTITLAAPLTKAHASGASLEFPAGGWSSDPIIIREGQMDLDKIKWTIPHEAGHRALSLADIDDSTDIMHWTRTWTDHRLRYCPRTKKHETGTENQWETIPR